jgi:hypothetical protein
MKKAIRGDTHANFLYEFNGWIGYELLHVYTCFSLEKTEETGLYTFKISRHLDDLLLIERIDLKDWVRSVYAGFMKHASYLWAPEDVAENKHEPEYWFQIEELRSGFIENYLMAD